MKNLYSFLGGRKLSLVLLSMALISLFAYMGKLSEIYIGAILVLNGVYSGSNVFQKYKGGSLGNS